MKTLETQAIAITKYEPALMKNNDLPVQSTFSLHPAQYDVFNAQLIDTKNPYLNVGGYIKLKGQLNVEKFCKAVNLAPNTVDAFRMRFHTDETEPTCFFDMNFKSLEIAVLDFSKRSNPEKEAVYWMKRRFNVAFAIHKEEHLFENVLIKIDAAEHWFFMRYHHLIMDGYGFTAWLQLLSREYKRLVAGIDTYPVYPLYINELIKANNYKKSSLYLQEGLYWKTRIAEKPKNILQSRYYNKKGQNAFVYTFELTQEQRGVLENLQQQTQCSLQHLTIAALLIYFGKTTGESEFIFGIPLHKRTSKQLRSVVGMFSNILPFKGFYKPTIKLIDFLREITLLQKRDYRYKNFLIGDISRQLHINPSNERLCDIVVNYESLNFELDFGEEIETTAIQLTTEFERIPLQFCWQDFGNKQPLQLQVIFRKDYFTHEEIALLTKRILFIIEQFPKMFKKEIENIDIIPFDERQLLQSFNNTAARFADDQSIIDVFEWQVNKTPHRIAVTFEGKQLTYQQLNESANQLAHYLHQKGIQENALVPICIERSLEMIIGVLAILKSGATYVPIDPAYPLARIQHILEDTATKVLLTSTMSLPRLPVNNNFEPITVDKEWPFIAEQPTNNLSFRVSPSTLVYVMYTSGSTGTPKGVRMPGSNLLNLLRWQEQQFNDSYRRVLQFASLNFDVSFQEIFSTLCFGSSLYLIHEQQRSDMPSLSSTIHQYGITHLFLPCVVLKCLTEYFVSAHIEHLPIKTLIVAGEQLQLTNDVKQIMDANRITLINQYGPTEAHVVCSYPITHSNLSLTLPPIGKPISNTFLYVLDSQLHLQPLGVAGEICITGACVAEGYLHNEKLTAEKFVANPFGKGYMYRTGDIGRWLPDGNLEFLGRKDDQVKIRGHRIELGEIESVLQQCSLVRQCVVTAIETNDGTKQLVCYVVTKQQFDRNALVSFLESILPGYMVPSLFVPLQALPVTTNGKIDKKALPPPLASVTEDFVGPKTALEAALVKIWQEVLGIQQINLHENFFELGGHSLLVVKTIAKINQYTGKKLPSGSLYRYPTVAKYATFLLDKSSPAHSTEHIVKIKAGQDNMPLYIVCPLALAPMDYFIALADYLDDNQTVYCLQLPEVLHLDSNAINIEEIAAKYVADLLAHDPKGPYALAGYSLGGLIAFEMAKQLKAKGKKLALLCLFDTVAYTAKLAEPATQAHVLYKKLLQRCVTLKKMILTLYHTIDDYLYKIKSDTLNTLRIQKQNLIRKIKRLQNNSTLEKKTESQLLQENIEKLALVAYKKYKITPLDDEIILFRAKRRIAYFETSKLLGWELYVRSIKVHHIEGNHYTIFDPAHRKHLAKLVQQCLDDCKAVQPVSLDA